MVTPAEFALPAAKFIAGPAFNAIRGAKKRQILRNAYAEAAFKVRSYYEQDRGIWFDGPSKPKWQAISSILKDEEFAQSLSLGAAPREEDIRLLRRKYGQEDPPLLEIVREMTLAIAEIACDTLPDDDSTVAGIVISLDAVRAAIDHQRYQRILDEFQELHQEITGLRDDLQGDSNAAEAGEVYWAGRPESLGDGFYGREDELDAIASSFTKGRAVVISGGAGSGKSRLAAEYAHGAKLNGFWTAGGTDLASTLVGLAPELGIDVEGKSVDEIARDVERGLAGLSPDTLWVVDNLADLEQMNDLLNGSGSVRLLISTRDSRDNLLPPTVDYHWIEVLVEEAAKDLLCSRSETSPDDPAVALIADKVGRLPLALEVLAARLGEPRQSPATVLEQLDQAPTVLQMEAFREALGATIPRDEGVFASIQGTLDDLEEQDRDALSGLAYVADAPVPEALAAALMGVDDEGLTALLSRCGRQSVLSWSEGHVRIHALTVAVLAATSSEGSLGGALVRSLSRLNYINTDDPVALRAELVHYEAMHTHAHQRLTLEHGSVLSFQNSLAIGYWTAGRNDDAIRLYELTLEVLERALGPEHPDTLRSRNNLAIGYRAAGRNDDAIALDEQTLEVRVRVLGPEHHDTLKSRNGLANGYSVAGRVDDAVRLFEQTLEVSERVLGPEHPDTLASRNNLAIGYRAAGRNDDAIALDEQTLEVMERVLGPEHPDTLTSRSNLAAGYSAAGRNDEAIKLDEQTLEVRMRILGPDHPDTLNSRNGLAIGYANAGRIDDAITLDEQTLKVNERVLGTEHPSTLVSRSNLAVGYSAAGRNDEAIKLEEQTLELMERVLGSEHPDTLASRGNLAAGYGDAGRIDDAITLDEQTLKVNERVLGTEHASTLVSRSNLAIGYRAAGRIDEAIRLWEQTLEAMERVLGPEHPDALQSRNNLAISYRAAGRDEDADKLESRG